MFLGCRLRCKVMVNGLLNVVFSLFFFLFVFFLCFVASFASPSRVLLLVADGVSCALFVFICLLFAVVGSEEWMHFDFVSGLLPWSPFIIIIIVVIFVFIIDAMTITTVSVILIHTKTCLSLNIISSVLLHFYTDIFQVCSTFVFIFNLWNHPPQQVNKSYHKSHDFHTDFQIEATLDAAPEKEQEQQEHETMFLWRNQVKVGVGKAFGKRWEWLYDAQKNMLQDSLCMSLMSMNSPWCGGFQWWEMKWLDHKKKVGLKVFSTWLGWKHLHGMLLFGSVLETCESEVFSDAGKHLELNGWESVGQVDTLKRLEGLRASRT